ncbi:MAG: DNA ligase D [Methylocystis sp.]|nr:DNA ligase D [Methylocystis sp.]
MRTAKSAKTASLKAYRAKRDFARTGEPKGAHARKASPKTGGLYVIQKHRARRLHFDLRLELDGVLKSWAVTKGPSLNPADKRLAVRVEDHPLEYGAFEGRVAEGEYGGGEVMIWDRGTWTPQDDPRQGLEGGRLKFDLDGERLKGGFALVRLRPRGKEKRESWLLVKERDETADRAVDPIKKWTRSVATGRSLEEITAGDAVWRSDKGSRGAIAAAPGARRKSKGPPLSMPRFRAPQLATPMPTPPSGAEWLHEIKFDGYRAIAAVGDGKSKLYTRAGLDWTAKFRNLGGALVGLPARNALIDGEVVATDAKGRGDFARLQRALKAGEDALRFYAFDLLELDGEDLAKLPLVERKARLSALLVKAPDPIFYSDHVAGNGPKILAECCRMGLEGVVSKRADKPYVSRRTLGWIKTKCTGRDEFVIGGWRPSTKERPFASLLLGEFDAGELRYRGRVGTGFGQRGLADIAQKLRKLARRTPPFVDAPAAIRRQARWVEPRLVAEIAYAERTADEYLRHPRFIGLREDKPASEVKAPAMTKHNAPSDNPGPPAPRPAVKLTHPDKVLFPAAGVTKAELAAYWRRVAPLAMPHIAGRPLSLVRCPEGNRRSCFFQRHHTRGMPKAIEAAPLLDSEGKREQFLKIEDAAGLEAAAQIGALELHIWGAHAASVERPDRLVFDLDPDPAVSFESVKRAARDFRALLEAAGLTSFALLTGGKGIHIVAPLVPALGWRELKMFAKGVAMRLAADDPARFTAVATKARRKGKVFIDYLRNERSASAIAPYSPRARETPSVAAPIGWSELSRLERADAYTIASLPRRLASLGSDPWEGYFDVRQTISEAALRMFAPSPLIVRRETGKE